MPASPRGWKNVCQSFFAAFSSAVNGSAIAGMAALMMPKKPFGADLETLRTKRHGLAESSGQIPFIYHGSADIPTMTSSPFSMGN